MYSYLASTPSRGTYNPAAAACRPRSSSQLHCCSGAYREVPSEPGKVLCSVWPDSSSEFSAVPQHAPWLSSPQAAASPCNTLQVRGATLAGWPATCGTNGWTAAPSARNVRAPGWPANMIGEPDSEGLHPTGRERIGERSSVQCVASSSVSSRLLHARRHTQPASFQPQAPQVFHGRREGGGGGAITYLSVPSILAILLLLQEFGRAPPPARLPSPVVSRAVSAS